MKSYANVQLLYMSDNKIVIRYMVIRKYLTDERPLSVFINMSPQDSEYKYYICAKHYNTWWGTKRYMNKIFEKPRTPSTFYR